MESGRAKIDVRAAWDRLDAFASAGATVFDLDLAVAPCPLSDFLRCFGQPEMAELSALY